MKKLIAFFLCLSLLSCNDGDIDIPAFEFENEVYGCDIRSNNYTLFKLATAEALIVTLSNNHLKNEVTTEPIKVAISPTNVLYRTFSDGISKAYFCEDIPPTEPNILSNWTGVSGASNFIIIETIEKLDDLNVVTGYIHFITFQNLKVEKGNKYLAFETAEFGEFITYL